MNNSPWPVGAGTMEGETQCLPAERQLLGFLEGWCRVGFSFPRFRDCGVEREGKGVGGTGWAWTCFHGQHHVLHKMSVGHQVVGFLRQLGESPETWQRAGLVFPGA